MSRILFLSQLLPYPPDAGPKVRSYFTLRYLAQRHQLTLLAFTRPDDTPQAVEHLKQYCEAVYTVPIRRSRLQDMKALASSLLAGDAFIIRRDALAEMAQKINALLESFPFDAIHSDQLWMAQYALSHRNGKDPEKSIKIILDEHNACFQIFQRIARGERNPLFRLFYEREWRALKRYEAQACRLCDQVVTVTEEDRRILESLSAAPADTPSILSRFTTIPICVDAQAVRPVPPAAGAKGILYIGTMFFLPNVEGVLWFAREVWPKVIAQAPQASFTVVGKRPPKEVRDLEAANDPAGSVIGQGGSIRVTGFVEELQPYLEQAAVFIVPLFSGSGMRVKIVDAWRWGLPVVSTTIGAEGIQYQDGENILIADDPVGFAQAVTRVLGEPALAAKLRENGRRWVEEHYDWQTVYPAWDQVYP